MELKLEKTEWHVADKTARAQAATVFGDKIRPGRHKDDNRQPTDAYGHGIPVYGVPLGDPEYVKRYLQIALEACERRVRDTVIKLYESNAQSLWAYIFHCFTQDAQYWARNVPPSQTHEMLQQFDSLLLWAASKALGTHTSELTRSSNSLAMRRLRLPARAGGAGLRDIAQVAPAAYLAAFSSAMRRMTHGDPDARGPYSIGFLHNQLSSYLVTAPQGHPDPNVALREIAAQANTLPMVAEANRAHKLIYDELETARAEGLLGDGAPNPLPPQLTGEGLDPTIMTPGEGLPPIRRGIQYTLTLARETAIAARLRKEAFSHSQQTFAALPPEERMQLHAAALTSGQEGHQ